jgi:TonB family protein
MALTTKGSPDLAHPANGGGSSQTSGNTSGQNPRSNPVCLDVPVAVRSLPPEKNSSSGHGASFSEEARTVIVFENGAVLRVSSSLPVGQQVIVSNAQGQEVVCRLAPARNLPSVKGYVEIEFVEPASNFWGIHQTPPQASAAVPPLPLALPSQPSPAGASHEPSAAPPVVSPMSEADSSSGAAPSFEDIAGLVPMSAGPDQPKQLVSQAATPKPSATLGDRGVDAGKPAAKGSTPSPTSNASMSPARAHVQAGAPKPVIPKQNDFLGKGMLGSGQISSLSSASESRGKTMALTVGAVIILVGLAGGYFFFYSGAVARSHITGAAATQSSAVTLPLASDSNQPGENTPTAEEQVPPAPPPAADDDMTPADREVIEAPPALPTPRHTMDNAVEKRPVRAGVQHGSIPSLKMKPPKAPRRNAERQEGETTPRIAELASEPAEMAPANAALPTVARTNILPAPPPPASASATPRGTTVRDPKLISSVRPMYPSIAKQAGIEGDVVISAEIDAAGKVREARAVSGPATLRQAAIDTVRHWKYAPALIDGKPAPAQLTVHVEFRLH